MQRHDFLRTETYSYHKALQDWCDFDSRSIRHKSTWFKEHSSGRQEKKMKMLSVLNVKHCWTQIYSSWRCSRIRAWINLTNISQVIRQIVCVLSSNRSWDECFSLLEMSSGDEKKLFRFFIQTVGYGLQLTEVSSTLNNIRLMNMHGDLVSL